MRQLEEKVQSLSKQLQDLQSTMQASHTKLAEDVHRAVEASLNGKQQPADAAAQPELKETLNEIQRHLQRLDNRISNHEHGQGAESSRMDLRGEVLREVERRLQDSCTSCLTGVEGLGRQQVEDRERMRALEKLVTSVDHRNREAVDGIQKHMRSLAGQLPKDCCPGLEGQVSGLEHRLEATSESLALLQQQLASPKPPLPPPWSVNRRMSAMESRVNTTQRGLEEHLLDLQTMLEGADERLRRAEGQLDFLFSRMNDFQSHANRALANLSRDVGGLKDSSLQQQGALERMQGAVHTCTQICIPPGGSQDLEVSSILIDLQRRVLGNEGQLQSLGSEVSGKLRQLQGLVGAHSNALSKLAGEMGELENRLVVSGSAGPPDLAAYSNRTNKRLETLEEEVKDLGAQGCRRACSVLQAEVGQLREQVESCQAACQPMRRKQEDLGKEPVDASKPLDGFSVIGGSSSIHLKSLQGELSEVILGFSSLNETLTGLQATVEKHQTDIHELSTTKDRIIAEINRVQQEVTEHVGESAERFQGLGREIHQFGSSLQVEASDCRRASGGLAERLGKLEGTCGQLEDVAGSLRKIKEGLDKHVSALWGCLREVNGTLRSHGAMLDKIHGSHLGTIHRRLSTLNSSFQALQSQLPDLSLQDWTGTRPTPPQP